MVGGSTTTICCSASISLLPQIPIVDSELRKAAGEEGGEEMEGERDKPTSPSQLVTSYGTYATQSAFTATPVSKEEKV